MYSAIYSQSILSFLKPLVLGFNGKCLGIEGVQFYPISLSLSLGKEVAVAERGLFSILCAHIHHAKVNSRMLKGWGTSYPSGSPQASYPLGWRVRIQGSFSITNTQLRGLLTDLSWIQFRSVVLVVCVFVCVASMSV